eukprot:4995857-Karenia_brevis.AAC.1
MDFTISVAGSTANPSFQDSCSQRHGREGAPASRTRSDCCKGSAAQRVPRPRAKAGAARTGAAVAKAPPRPKQTAAQLQNAIADASGLAPQDAKCFLEALPDVAANSPRETNVFKLHNIVFIRMRKASLRNAIMKFIFGKEVMLRAKPAGEKLTVLAAKPLRDALSVRD